MKVTPLEVYKKPRYPDKKKVMENPDILKTIPERWKGNLCVGAAFSTLLLFSLTACIQKNSQGVGGNKEGKEIAPLFEHGTGRGSFGCESIAPPAFLSEEEAFEVIQEEIKGYNISFEKKGLELEDVKVPETKYYLGDTEINSTQKLDLELDGYNKEKKIAFEFVSLKDYEEWSVEQGIRSSVDDYDFLSTAKLLQKGLEKKNADTTIGVLYDPMTRLSDEERNEISQSGDWSVLEKRARELAKEDLKKQVQDFLQWLQGQGLI